MMVSSSSNERSFEVVTVSEAALQSIRGRSASSSHRQSSRIKSTSTHNTRISFQQRVWMTLFVLALMVVDVASLFGVFTSEHDLQELRLEFKKDIESLRSQVEHELLPHLLATAKKQENKKAVQSIVGATNPFSWGSLEAISLPSTSGIYDTIVDSWIYSRDAIQSFFEIILWKASIRFPKLMYTIGFANEYRWVFGIIYAIWAWLAYRLYYKLGADGEHGKTKQKNPSFKTPSKMEVNDDCSEDASDGGDVMNHMFHDAMATSGWPVVVAPAYTSTNGRMSKEERRRRARENALKYAARDKQRLERRRAPARTTPAPAPARVYNLTEPARADLASPRVSKKERLKQARARAKAYGARDMEQIHNKRRNRNH